VISLYAGGKLCSGSAAEFFVIDLVEERDDDNDDVSGRKVLKLRISGIVCPAWLSTCSTTASCKNGLWFSMITALRFVTLGSFLHSHNLKMQNNNITVVSTALTTQPTRANIIAGEK